jgi:hypothetical protein
MSTTSSVSLVGYETVPPTVGTTAFSSYASTTTTTSATTITSHSESTSPTSTGTAATSTSIESSATTTASASYRQILSGGVVADIPWCNLAQSDLDVLCPSHDCVQDCQNYTRLFEEVPYLITESFDTYGKSVNGKAPNITLFGVCSNLAEVYDSISAGTNLKSAESYFPLSSQNDIGRVSTTVASCLASTCDQSRENQNCIAACNMTVLYPNHSTTNLTAVTACLSMLCGNTCGLPYANQDVMGVGVSTNHVRYVDVCANGE